jgi:hypothetical protein
MQAMVQFKPGLGIPSPFKSEGGRYQPPFVDSCVPVAALAFGCFVCFLEIKNSSGDPGILYESS